MCRNSPRLWSYEPFCLPVAAIARAHDPTVIVSGALRKGLQRLCPHRSDCCRALTFTCRNSPSWQRCDRCNVLFSFGRHGAINWTAWSSRDMCINWNERRVNRLQLYEQLSAWTMLEYELVDTNWGIRKVWVEPTRSAVATCII